MPTYLLLHEHARDECARAFAAWQGFDSPLRHGAAIGACRLGDHRVFWQVDAADPEAARALVPPFVGERTEFLEVRPIPIP